MANGFIDPLTGLTGDPTSPKTPPVSKSPQFFDPLNYGAGQVAADVGMYDATTSKYDEDITLRDLQTATLEEQRAFTQPTGDKWRNGLIKFAGKTGTAVAGGTIGTFAGLGNIIEGKSYYDNDFQRMLDRWNEGMDEALPNHYSREEQQANFWKSMGTANFWANDVLSGMSFTVGAVLTEIVWSAATAATLGAAGVGQTAVTAGLLGRGARYLKNFSRAEDAISAMQKARRATQIGSTMRVGRQIWTGAGYEAGVEARHHKKELVDKLNAEWLEANPDAKQIPVEVAKDIEERATQSANGVFGANMVVVGSSNMLALPKIYGPGIKSQMNAFSAIGRDYKKVGDAWKNVFTPAYKNTSKLTEIVKAVGLTAKNPFVEGIWEEGMQGVANNTMLDYTTKKYNPNGTDETVNLMESFGEGLQETYGGQQGWKEIGIGMIIGSIGSPNFRAYKRNEKGQLKKQPGQPIWTGGIAGEFQARKLERRRADQIADRMNNIQQEDLIEYLKKNPEALKSTRSLTEHAVRSAYLNKELDTAMEGKDVFEAKNVENDIIHSYIMSRIDGGYEADLVEEFGKSVADMSNNEFAATFGYETLSEEELEQRKAETIEAFEKRVNDTKKVANLVDGTFQADLSVPRNKDIRESLIYAGSVINDVQKREDAISKQIEELTGVVYDPAERGTEYKERFEEDVNEALKRNPEHKTEVEKAMKDLSKLQRRRELFIDQYNRLFTKKGQEEYKNLIEENIKQVVNDQIERAKKAYEDSDTVFDRENEKRYRKRKNDDGSYQLIEIDENDKEVEGGEVIDVEKIDEEFMVKYDIEEENLNSDPLSPEESEQWVKWFNNVKDPFALVEALRERVAPRNLSPNDPVLKAAEEAYKRLTGKTLSKALLNNLTYEDAIFVHKESGKRVLVRKDNSKEDTYYVKEIRDRDNTKNIGDPITREQLYENYDYEKVFSKHEQKRQVINNINNLIDSKLALLDTAQEGEKALREELDALVKENEEYIEKLKRQKGDGRATRNSIKKTQELIAKNEAMRNRLQKKLNTITREQAKLEVNLEYLYKRLKEETDKNEIADLNQRVSSIKEDIDYNRKTISRWRDILTNLEKLTNKLLNLFDVGNAYIEKGPEQIAREYEAQLRAEMMDYMTAGSPTEVMMIDGKPQKVSSFEWHQRQKKAEELIKRRVAAKKAAVARAIDRAVKAEGELIIARERMEQAENQMYAFTKANDDLYNELEFVKEEINALEDHKVSTKYRAGGFNASTNKTEDSKTSEPQDKGYFEEGDVASDPMRSQEEETFWKSLKRSIKDVFRGLTGSHINSDGSYTSDKSQRRYYRWVAKTDIAGEQKYSIRVIKAPPHMHEQIKREKYDPKDAYIALVIDENGEYITEEPGVTTGTDFDVTRNIYTSFPLPTLTTEKWGDKYYNPEVVDKDGKVDEKATAKNYARLYGARVSLADARKAFEADKKNAVAKHNALVNEIKKREAAGKEVILPLVDKSIGIANNENTDIPFEERPVMSIQSVLGHGDVVMSVNTTDELPLSSKTVVNNRKGVTFLYDNETGNVFEVKPKTLSTEQIDAIVNMFRSFIAKSQVNEKGKITSKGASELKLKNGDVSEKDMWQFLSDFTFWTGNNRIVDKKKKTSRVWNNNNKTKFHFNKDYSLDGVNPVNGGAINLGGTDYPIMFVTEDNRIVPNADLIDENGNGALRDFLQTQRVNISSRRLRSEEDFVGLESVTPDGVITTKSYPSEQGGYKSYLMGDNSGNHLVGLFVSPKGKTGPVARDEEGNAVIEEIPQVKSQYAIYSDSFTERPASKREQEKKKEVKKQQEREVGTTVTSPDYKGFPDVKPGDRLKVEVVLHDGSVASSGIVEIDEGNSASLVEGTGNLSPSAVKNITAILNADNRQSHYDGMQSVYRAKPEEGGLGAELRIANVETAAKEEKQPAKTKKTRTGRVDLNDLSHGDVVYDTKGSKLIFDKKLESGPLPYVFGTEGDAFVVNAPETATFFYDKESANDYIKEDEDYDDSPYRTPTNDDRGLENMSKAEKWFKERFPYIDFKTVQHLIDGKHHGQLHKAAVYIYEQAEAGTTYHEAFHVVTHVLLNRRERRSLYREFRKRNPKLANLSDKVIEEHLAEQFREYMLYREETAQGTSKVKTEEERKAENERFKQLLKEYSDPNITPERQLELDAELAEMYYAKGEMVSPEAKKFKRTLESYKAPVQKSIFEKIYDWIMNLIGRRSRSILEIFEAIESNEFRNETPNISFAKDVTLRRTPKGKDEVFAREAIEGVNFHFFKKLYEDKNNVATLFSRKDNSKLVNSLYNYAHRQIKAKIRSVERRLEGETNEIERGRLEKIIEELRYIDRNWNSNENYTDPVDRENYSIVRLHKDYLAQYRLEFVNIEDSINEINKTADPDNQWANESMKISSKINASRNIKLLLGTIVDVEVRDGANVSKLNSLELPRNLDFGTAFNILANKLAGLTTVEDMIQVINSEIVPKFPGFEYLVRRLKLDQPVDSLTLDDVIQQTQFFQSFAKFNNQYTFDINGENGKFKIINANDSTVRRKILQQWKTNAAKDKNLYVMKDGVPYYNPDVVKGVPPIRTGKDAIDFLKKLGIVYSNPQEFINDPALREKAGAIRTSIDKGNQISIFNIDFDTGHTENFRTILDFEVDSTVDYIENGHYNIDGSLVYNVVLNNYLTSVINSSKNFATLDSFLDENPHLDPNNNLYIKNSLLFPREVNGKMVDGILYDKNGNRKDDAIELYIHEGSKEEQSGETKEFDNLGQPDQLRIHINLGRKNIFPLIRPADNSIERYIKFQKPFMSSSQIGNENLHIVTMMNYLKDEIQDAVGIATDINGSASWNHAVRKQEDESYDSSQYGIVMSILSKDSMLKSKMDALLNDPEYTMDEFFGDINVIRTAERLIEDYFASRLKSMRDLIIRHGIVEESGDQYVNNGLDVRENDTRPDSPQLSIISRDKLNTVLKNYIINDTISNIEQTKIIFGNPVGYKSVSDQFKRQSGVVGTKKTSAVYDQINQWISRNLKRTDREGGLFDKITGKKPIVRTAVFNDVHVKSDYYEEYSSLIGDKASPYADMEEGDGQGYITIDEWREMLFRSGDWTAELEQLYQYETNPAARKDIDPTKLPVANPIKPQYMGPLAEDGFHMGMYKLSLLPLLPSVTKDFPQLEALRKKMNSQGVGIAVFSTANKVGTKLNDNREVQPFYDDNGQVSFENTDLVTQDTYYKYWGIQQDMGSKSKKKVVSGTQMAKQILNGVFRKGEPIDEELGNYAVEYMSLNAKRIFIGMTQLIDSLGLKEGKDGNYEVDNLDSLIERFVKEAVEREMPDNIIDGIRNLKTGSTIDTLVNKEKVENILLSIADSMSISQKRSGSPKVQVSNAVGKGKDGYREVADRENGVLYKSSDLKFYTNKSGEVTQMEVYLPAYLKGHIPLDSKLTDLIGFRIPTQGLNSIESIKVKGFLPAVAGDTVIVPSEIVAKTGSDFDIDKLNLYYPNVYYNAKGNPRYIEYRKNLDDYRDDYEEYVSGLLGRLTSRIVRDISGGLTEETVGVLRTELRKIITREGANFTDIVRGINELLVESKQRAKSGNAVQRFAYGELSKQYEKIQGIMVQIAKDVENDNSTYFDPISLLEFSKRGIENRISELQKNIILHPKNFKQLITPISARQLSDEAKDIREMKGLPREEAPSMHNIAEREYLMQVARRFIGGKKAVGITALHSTFDILAKMEDVSIIPQIFVFRKNELQPVSTEIRLPHNKNERGEISLSETYDANQNKDQRNNIAEMLSQWINAAVDAATDPFMFDLNSGPDTLNTVLYLTMTGVPLKHLARFMTQPIILEYIANRQKWESQMMEGNTKVVTNRKGEPVEVSKKKFRDDIIEETQSKYVDVVSLNDVRNNPVKEFTIEQLESGIKRGAQFERENRPMAKQYAKHQLQILDDFLRYQDTAGKLRDVIQGSDYDTNSVGKNTSELGFRLKFTENVKSEDNFVNYDRIIESGFINPYWKTAQDIQKALTPLFVTMKDQKIVDQFDKLYSVLLDQAVNIPKESKVKVVDKFKMDIITYLFVTRPFKINGQLYKEGVPMYSQIDRLFKGDDSIAHRFEKKKKEYSDRNMVLFDYLEANINEDKEGTHHIIARTKKLDALDSNRLTNEWKELFSSDPEFATDLAMASILQYGLQNSPYTFTNLIPADTYSSIMTSILEDVNTLPDDQRAALYDRYFREFFPENFNSNDIVPTARKAKLSALHLAYPYHKRFEYKDEYAQDKMTNKERSELKNQNVYIYKDKPKVINSSDTTSVANLDSVSKDFRNRRLLTGYGRIVPEGGEIQGKNTTSTEEYSQLKSGSKEAANEQIDTKVKNWLTSVGIEYQNVENITDRDGNPIDAIAKADMLHKVVQVVEGKADITTLSEEAAHFLVELLGDDNPILKGMMNAVEGTDVYKEVVADYKDLYNGDETKLKKEAVGKMIAKAIVRKEKVKAEKLLPWWQRAWRWIKRKLSGLSSSNMEKELAPFMDAADIILGESVEGLKDINELKTTEIFYQVTEEEKERRDTIEANLNENRVSRDLEKKGYKTAGGKKVKNRVTDVVKKFNRKRFRTGDLKEWEVTAHKGTIIHKYLEIIGEAIFAGKDIKWKDVEGKVIKDLTNPNDAANEDFLGKDDSYFQLRDSGQFGELVHGMKQIKEQVLNRQKQIDPKGEVKFFPEFIVYDETADIAGTIDLLVLYSNGSVGIYDYKSVYRLKEKDEIPIFKEQEWEKQIIGYKDILASSYGVRNFAETRVIPIDMSLNKNPGDKFARIGMGSIGLTEPSRPYLTQVPVAKELSGDENLDKSLIKMLNLYDTLRTKYMSNYKDDKLKDRINRLRENIHKIQLDSDVSYIYGEIQTLYDEFEKRVNLPLDHKDALKDDVLIEFMTFVDVYDQFGVNAMDAAKEAGKKKTVENLKKVAHMLEYLRVNIRQKMAENANNSDDFIDVTGSAKAEGFAGRLFKQLSKFNRPVFKKLAMMVRGAADQTRREVNKIAEDVNKHTEELKKWASSQGMSLLDAYGKIIKDETGDLIPKFSKKFYEDKKKAFKDKSFAWVKDNMEVRVENGNYYYTGDALERYTKAREKYHEGLMKSYPGDKNMEFRNRRRAAWDKKFNITENADALFSNTNYFMDYKDKPENFSDEYNYMLRHEPLKNYYEMYIKYNKQFKYDAGVDINHNFVANIHTNMIDKVGQSGLGAISGIKDSFMRSMEIREFDTSKGTIDPATGKPIHSIPIFHTDKLRGRLGKKDIQNIREDILRETDLKENSDEFNEELEKRIQQNEFSKGVKSKSRDLSRSLIIFAETAYNYKHLSESEAAALSLLEILKGQTQETELVDGSGKKVLNKYTGKVATMLGVPAGEIDALEKFINLNWYGQQTQSGDITFGKDDKYSLTKAYQNVIKLTSATAIGLKPILAAGNALGIKSNFYMSGAEGTRYKKEDIKAAHKMFINRDKRYKYIIDYFAPHTRDINKKKADDLSASKMISTFTMDNIYIMHRKGDEMVDNNILVAMMHRYGIDENGRVTRLDKIKGKDKESLIDRMSIEDDKVVIRGLTDREYTRFRAMVQTTAVGIKGNIPQEDKNLIGTTLVGQMLMQFRSWMPGLIEKRFKELGYDDLFDDYDVGRFRVFFGEFSQKGFLPFLKNFSNLLGEVMMMNVYNRKGVNQEVTKRFYDRFKLQNPDTTLTMEEFVELRKAKLRGMAAELRIFFGFMIAVMGGKAMLPEEEDESAIRDVIHLIAQNSLRITQRGALEISFFLSPESVATILKSPIPSLRLFTTDIPNVIRNTFDETRDVIFGEDSTRDKTPRFYYFSKIVPIGSSAVDFFDIWDTYNKDRRRGVGQ